MIATKASLIIDIRSYWHAGTGRGSGSHLDALIERDAEGLPYLPGKTVKGLLRDALRLWEYWESDNTSSLTDSLFGTTGTSGLLRIGDARIPLRERTALAMRAELKPLLFESLFNTAIDHERGAYAKKSLRGIEVALPMELGAEITPLRDGVPPDWCSTLRKALPFVRGIGACRNRGLGRAVLTLSEVKP